MSEQPTIITGSKFTAWVIPVKVEDLKAGLRTLMATAERRAALQDCTVRLGVELPPELLDMIMDLVPDLYQKRRKQWTALYRCSTNSPGGVLGTVVRRAVSMTSGGKTLQRYFRLLKSDCHFCSAKTCKYCQACLNYLSKRTVDNEIWSPIWNYAVDYEDSLVDVDNPIDKHIHQYFHECIAQDAYYTTALEALANQWHAAVDDRVLFTDTERVFLRSCFGIDCWVQHNKQSASPFSHTTALLYVHKFRPGYSEAEYSGDSVRSVGPVGGSPLPTEEQDALTRALRVLRLVPCDQLERQHCTAQGTGQARVWPRHVMLQEQWVQQAEV